MKKILSVVTTVAISISSALSLLLDNQQLEQRERGDINMSNGLLLDNSQQLKQAKNNLQISDGLDQFNDINEIEKIILRNENRSFQHSFLTPTGYFLEKGKEYLIKINKKAKFVNLLYISIGQFGVYENLNNDQSVEFETQQIIGETLNIAPKISGMLYLKDYRFTNAVKILSISKNDPIKVPTFIVGETNQETFFNEIKATNSFFVEIISQHVFGTFQTEMFKNQIINSSSVNINNTILVWDQIWKYSNETYGLNEGYSGVAKKYQQFIHISNPDTGPGYASANNYRVTFQNKTDAGKNLFVRKITDQWGLWHEIGHTYQTPQYNWSNLTEVTVNISALYVQKQIANINNLDNENNIKKVKDFFANDKDFNDEGDLFVKLTMFWQLQLAFGDYFYPTLSQFYRTNHLGIVDKQQDFVKITSKIANRNLIPFFDKWGVTMTNDTKKAIEQLPSLKKNIWENIVNGTHQPVIEWQLPKYQLSTLKYEITSKKTINFATKITETNLNDFFDISKNTNILANEISFGWINYYLKENNYYVPTKILVKDNDLLSNTYIYFVPVSFVNSLQFIGYSNYQRGIVGLDQKNKRFFFTGSEIGLDASQNKEKEYYQIIIKNQKKEVVKKIIFKADDNFNNIIFVNNLLDIPYQESYTIEIENLLKNKTRLFNVEKNTWESNDKKNSKYLIKNDTLIAVFD
ncbi:MAG: M60 family metallopeptidase [Spiroplasma sp.]|nr:M60 family metallopeptidase [Spiroplasma sp.]